MSMAWYLESYSNERFERFRSEPGRAKRRLTEYYTLFSDSFDPATIDRVVEHFLENGLTYQGWPTARTELLDTALELLFCGDEELDDFKPNELFDIVSETEEPFHTNAFILFADLTKQLTHPILRELDYREMLLLTPADIRAIRDETERLLHFLDGFPDDRFPRKNVVVTLLENVLKTFFRESLLKTFFRSARSRHLQSPVQAKQTQRECLLEGLLKPMESILSKGKHAFWHWG